MNDGALRAVALPPPFGPTIKMNWPSGRVASRSALKFSNLIDSIILNHHRGMEHAAAANGPKIELFAAAGVSTRRRIKGPKESTSLRRRLRFQISYFLPLFFIISWPRLLTSAGDRFSMCVLIHHWLPAKSRTPPWRSPQNWSAGVMTEAAPAFKARLYVASASLTYR